MSNNAKVSKAQILQRIVIEGKVKLMSPLLIGTGQDDGVTDILVLKNKAEEPFIPGTSLAGVLRAEYGKGALRKHIFGELNSTQSNIVVSDIVLKNAKTVIRDGVAIDEYRGVGKDGAKYDYEAVDRGAEGELRIVFTRRQWQEPEFTKVKMQEEAEKIAGMLMNGIRVGAITAKGFGKLAGVPGQLKLKVYDFENNAADVLAWLYNNDPKTLVKTVEAKAAPQPKDFILEADFALKTSLLVRANSDDEAREDGITKIAATQMRSDKDYVIPGTSLKGVLRHRALEIMRVLGKNSLEIDELTGYFDSKDKKQEKNKHKSRLLTDEIYFNEGVKEFPQTRNKIDRFTGATVDSALFTNIPVWQENNTASIHMKLTVKKCEPWEAGLMLLLLKDLWTGDLAIGGEKSIGRGILRGIAAKINFNSKQYDIIEKNGFSIEGNIAELEGMVQALKNL